MCTRPRTALVAVLVVTMVVTAMFVLSSAATPAGADTLSWAPGNAIVAPASAAGRPPRRSARGPTPG